MPCSLCRQSEPEVSRTANSSVPSPIAVRPVSLECWCAALNSAVRRSKAVLRNVDILLDAAALSTLVVAARKMPREGWAAYAVPGMDLEMPSLQIVKLISWFGLAFGVLHVVGGRELAVVEIGASAAGLFGTWSDVHNRGVSVAVFTVCWGVQFVLESVYFLLLLASLSARATDAVLDAVTSSTFQNLATPLRNSLKALRSDSGGFVIFSALTSSTFAALALYYGTALWREIYATAVLPERAPLVARSIAGRTGMPSGISGFGSLRQTESAIQPPPSRQKSFQGKGNRLGME